MCSQLWWECACAAESIAPHGQLHSSREQTTERARCARSPSDPAIISRRGADVQWAVGPVSCDVNRGYCCFVVRSPLLLLDGGRFRPASAVPLGVLIGFAIGEVWQLSLHSWWLDRRYCPHHLLLLFRFCNAIIRAGTLSDGRGDALNCCRDVFRALDCC